MSNKLDGKFHGIVVKSKDQSIVPEDEWIVFLAKDNALLPMLKFYREECERIGADLKHLYGIDHLIAKVGAWRYRNPEKCKVPDTNHSE
jgi:hypothetical protein